MFYKWLTAARTARHRRVVLQEKEQEMKRYMLASAWDRWRGAYKTEKLRPVVCLMSTFHSLSHKLTLDVQEHIFTLQNQNALMYRGFVTWHAKTKVNTQDQDRKMVADMIFCSHYRQFVSMHRIRKLSFGRCGETLCLALFKPRKPARWTRRPHYVRPIRIVYH